MRYQQDLQVQLRDRYRRLITSGYHNGPATLALVVGWIKQQQALQAIIAEAERASPEIDLVDFKQSMRQQEVRWVSDSEAEQATFGWKVMVDLVGNRDPNDDDLKLYVMNYGSSGNLNDYWRELVEQVMQPFFDYAGEHISAGNSVLHVLERYVRTVEWFRREELHAKYANETANGEEVYNLDLQSFLFQDGNYITHAKARGASGEPDLIGDLATEDPLICDGKIFGHGRMQSYLAKGYHQVLKYAQDYNKNTAYLVIFNLTNRLLQMPTDGKPGDWPAYIDSNGVRVYFVVIRALPPATTASKAGKAPLVTIDRDDLFDPNALDFEEE
jgi:hypothetical protein